MRTHGVTWLAVLSVVLLQGTAGYKIYQDEIPNGGNVPHPCKSNYKWQGVGHNNVLGGGPRNPFGQAFANAGKTWTAELCAADSDQDGKSNGMELGDPSCSWTKGNPVASTTGLSHPGICEPTNSTDCMAKNQMQVDCSEGADFTCFGLGEPESLNVTIQLDRTLVPTKETTYMCQSFSLPDDKQYHLFGSKPLIDNAHMMHHTIIYGCKKQITGYNTPTECDMGNEDCTTIIATWTVGQNGECSGSDQGILVGKDKFTTILIEQHWNNPTGLQNEYDSSGLVLFLTSQLRRYNVGFLSTGQELLSIPGGKSSVALGAVCPSSCTYRRLKDDVYIDSANIHMHYLGKSGRIEHWRNGQLYETWLNVPAYDYELPITDVFDPPKVLKPGDEIKTFCTFDSSTKDTATYYGLATSDEMCYGFLSYYPAENGPEECVSYGEYDACELEDYYDYDAGAVLSATSTFIWLLFGLLYVFF